MCVGGHGFRCVAAPGGSREVLQWKLWSAAFSRIACNSNCCHTTISFCCVCADSMVVPKVFVGIQKFLQNHIVCHVFPNSDFKLYCGRCLCRGTASGIASWKEGQGDWIPHWSWLSAQKAETTVSPKVSQETVVQQETQFVLDVNTDSPYRHLYFSAAFTSS